MSLNSFAILPLVSRILVALGWVAFFAFLFFQKRAPGEKETKRDSASKAGIALQMVGYALVWMLQRHLPLRTEPLPAWEVIEDVLAPVLSVVSAWFGLTAVRTLGKQWSYTARVVEGHQLVTQGPYQIVRHPIYTGMFGKLLATNFAFGHWIGLVTAAPIFMIGTMIRIRAEEKLLQETFGEHYVDYARRVKSFIPLIA